MTRVSAFYFIQFSVLSRKIKKKMVKKCHVVAVEPRFYTLVGWEEQLMNETALATPNT